MKMTIKNIGKSELTELVDRIAGFSPDVSSSRLGNGRCEITLKFASEKTVLRVRELIQADYEMED